MSIATSHSFPPRKRPSQAGAHQAKVHSLRTMPEESSSSVGGEKDTWGGPPLGRGADEQWSRAMRLARPSRKQTRGSKQASLDSWAFAAPLPAAAPSPRQPTAALA